MQRVGYIAAALLIAVGCGSPKSGPEATDSSSAAASSETAAASSADDVKTSETAEPSESAAASASATDTIFIVEEPSIAEPVIETPGEADDPIVTEDDGIQMTFTLPDGTTRKLSEFRGKRVLIDFWATW